MTYQSEVAPLRRVLLKHARDAFVSSDRIAAQWQQLGYWAPPDYDAACREFDGFASLLERAGVALEWLPQDDNGIDSIYARDATIVSDLGSVLCRMGKGARSGEPDAQARHLGSMGVPAAGRIVDEGCVEGGDAAWVTSSVLAVGRGYRTNAEGIDQLEALLPADVRIERVPLPHWTGPADVFHLMSILSPIAEDVVLVYSRLLPVPFRERLIEWGFQLIEVPDEEFDSLGCNVLAVAPRVVVALAGNPETERRLRAADVEVHAYTGLEISRKGCGGPTCLVRPLERDG